MLTTLIIIYSLFLLWSIFSIVLFGSRPSRSIAWLFVVVVVPFLGMLFYILFGINRKRFKFFTLNNLAKRRLFEINNKTEILSDFKHSFDGKSYEKLGKLMHKSSGFPAVDGNDIKILHDGEDTFEAIFKEIRTAKSFIHLQYYIMEKGQILDKLCHLLIEKLQEGVEVRIIYDALGSFYIKRKTINELKKYGAKVFSILPFNIKTILSTINFRNHRKLVVIDGLVAYTGGVNISDKYIDAKESELGIWDDLHLRLEGAAVDHVHRVFIKDYYFCSKESLYEDSKYLPEHKKEGGHLVQVVSGGPDLDNSSILHQYVMMIHSAHKVIRIQNPYFIPNKMLLEALTMACLRGVEVIVMVPNESDSVMAKFSMYSNFEDLLRAGIKICIVKELFFHSKLIVVDENIASVGSGNFDYRSFEHNYELNILMYDHDLAKELITEFDELCSNSSYLYYETFKKRPLKDKLLQGFARIFSPLL